MIMTEVSHSAGEMAEGNPLAGVGLEAVAISLSINGATHALRIEPRTTVAEALRDQLALAGTKIACDRGACSACTVWLDGLPVCSCMILAIEVGSRRLTTIEGLTQHGQLHRVQAAFIEYDAVQCGFCTPGLVMSCAALLEHTPNPTVDEIKSAISGHFCRCGTYPHVIAAALAAAQPRRG
jgi:xanthine dehydrogenase YagT iron-sulfur-binding subunit